MSTHESPPTATLANLVTMDAWRSFARVLVDELDHPEGVAWDPESETLYAGGEAGQIYAGTLDGRGFGQVAEVPGLVLGIAVDGRGRLAVCSSSDGSLCVVDRSVTRVLLTEVEGRRLCLPNYPAFGQDGTLFVSDSGTWKQNDGRLCAIAPDGHAYTLTDRLPRFTNGLAVSPDGDWVYVVESLGPAVSRVRSDGSTEVPETIVELPGTVPDGLAFLADGGLIISCYRPDRIYLLDTDGSLILIADDPEGTLLAAPTNVAFAGPTLDVLITANLNRRHLTRLDLGLIGAPLHRPVRWAADAGIANH